MINLKTTVWCGVLSVLLSTLTQCDTDIEYRDPIPVKLSITGFTPRSAVGGASIKLIGTKFDLVPAHNRIMFNGVEANVTEALPNQLTVTVPSNAVSGKITVTVNNETVTTADEFVIPAPLIQAVSPSFGGVGDAVYVTMKNIPLDKRETFVVKVNGVMTTIQSWITDNIIKVTVPKNATTGKVTVSIPGQILTSTTDFEVVPGIPYPGLAAFYDFSGPIDRSGNLNSGNFWRVWPCVDRYEQPSGAYEFDGDHNYVSIGNPESLQLSGSMTLSLWIKAPAFQGEMYLISKASTDAGAFPSGYLLMLQNINDNLSYVVGMPRPEGSPAGEVNYLSAAPFLPNVWECVAFTLEENTMVFYKNGVETNRVSNHVRLRSSSDPLVFGRNSYGPFNRYTGILDDIFIYNRALTPVEIKQLYDQRITSRPR